MPMVTIYNSARPRADHCQFIFGAIGNIIGSIIGAESAKESADMSYYANAETNRTNLQLAREQNDWNYDMWQKTNEYNTTANQLARWSAAGLNPNSFASQASPVAANTIQSADLANQQAPDLSALNGVGVAWQNGINAAVSNLLSYKKLSIENKKADAEISNLGANTEYIQTQVKSILPQSLKESESRTALNNKTVEQIEKSFAEIDARIENLYAQANLADTKSNESKLNMNFLRDSWDKKMLSLDLTNHLMRSDICKNYKQASVFAEQLKGIVLDNGVKGNEIAMMDITNWMKKVQAASSTWQYLSDTEKLNKEAEMSSFIATIMSGLSNGFFDAFDQQEQRRNWRYNSWQWLQDQNKSWFNPLPSR